MYRNAHNAFFKSIDKYFTPFIAPNKNRSFSTREQIDILPENNQGLCIIPQVLTNHAEDFIRAAKELEQFGYGEINLNLGCPSKTVVSKHKGAGFLEQREALVSFLEQIYSHLTIKISIKTRIGMESPEEFYKLLEIYNSYPIEELIIHPRLQKDYYKNKPHLDIFTEAMRLSKNPVCYNGDIFTAKDYNQFTGSFPQVERIMCGRGLVANPGLMQAIQNNKPLDKQVLRQFHDKIYEEYQDILYGEKNVLFKMKELWFYMIYMFSNAEKYAKKLKKAERLCDYEQAVASLFLEQDIVQEAGAFHSKTINIE